MLHTAWIARHGHRHDYVDADWFNKAERPYDPPLSEDGLFQAQELGERLQSEQIVHLFSSPFLRAVQTAHHAAEALDLPIKLEAGLSEWHNSEWMSDMPERLSTDELAEHYPRIDLTYTSRSNETFMERTGETARQLVGEFSQNILMVGHGAVVLGITTGLLEGYPTVNASLWSLLKLVRPAKKWQMQLCGDISHLSDNENLKDNWQRKRYTRKN